MAKTAAFYCTTFRRPGLLQDAVACFLAQEWEGRKVLVVINDEPMQELVFDHPDVRIVNRRERLPLAAKRNIAISECMEFKPDYLFPMDDDDLFAPDRISTSVEHMAGGIFKTDRFFIDTDPIKMVVGRNLGNYAFAPGVIVRYGCYSAGHRKPHSDINLMDRLDYFMQYHGLVCSVPGLPFMMYRKHVSSDNLSKVQRNDSQVLEAEPLLEKARIELSPEVRWGWNFRTSLFSPAPIHTVDETYSKVDLRLFYKGIERQEDNG